jgi:hypothetical protein
MIQPLKSVTLSRTQGERVRSTMWAVILDDGALESERSDYGAVVEEFWRRDEHEYNATVPVEYKDTVLLLIKDYVRDEAAFRGWLEEMGMGPHFPLSLIVNKTSRHAETSISPKGLHPFVHNERQPC